MTDEQKPVNDLGPLEPHKKPRKKAKIVLAGIVAAAGIAGGTAYLASKTCVVAGALKPATISTTKPGSTTVRAEPKLFPGTTAPSVLKTDTQPARTTQPAAMESAKPDISSERRKLAGDISVERFQIQDPSTKP